MKFKDETMVNENVRILKTKKYLVKNVKTRFFIH